LRRTGTTSGDIAQRERAYPAKTFPEINLQKGPILSSPDGHEFGGGAELVAPGRNHSIL